MGEFLGPGADDFMGYNLAGLEVDQAYLEVESAYPQPLNLYSLSHGCYECPFQPLLKVDSNTTTNTTLATHHPWDLLLTTAEDDYLPTNTTSVCSIHGAKLGGFGVYQLTLSSDGECTFNTLKSPVFEYGALIVVFAGYAALILLALGVKALYRHLRRRMARISDSEAQVTGLNMVSSPDIEASSSGVKETPKPQGKQRLKSLDTFRGISIVLMIFVNFGAGKYWFLEHATWDGLQLADVVFPWFMWIMGVCIPMGISSALRRNTPRSKIFTRILKRSLKLFFLGIILNSIGGPVWLQFYRIPGVLQRFGACYFVVTSIALAFTPSEPKQYQSNFGIFMSDVLQLLPQWGVHLLILLTHTLITFLLPVPGCPTGYLGPGGVALLQNGTSSPQCIGGAAGEVDRWLLTSKHIYQYLATISVYGSAAFDPEGVLGTMTSIFQVFLGVQAGIILQAHPSHKGRVGRWLVWAVVLLVLGFGLDRVIPINKNIWSMSFVFVTSGLAFFLLSCCYLLVDVWGGWSGTPFFQAGMNSIFLYVGHMITYNLFPWHYVVGGLNTHFGLLIETLWGTTLWILTALYLHRKGKFYTV